MGRPQHAITRTACLLLAASCVLAQPPDTDIRKCGELVAIETHDATTTRYALNDPQRQSPGDAGVALVLLVGGGGRLDLD